MGALLWRWPVGSHSLSPFWTHSQPRLPTCIAACVAMPGSRPGPGPSSSFACWGADHREAQGGRLNRIEGCWSLQSPGKDTICAQGLPRTVTRTRGQCQSPCALQACSVVSDILTRLRLVLHAGLLQGGEATCRVGPVGRCGDQSPGAPAGYRTPVLLLLPSVALARPAGVPRGPEPGLQPLSTAS